MKVHTASYEQEFGDTLESNHSSQICVFSTSSVSNYTSQNAELLMVLTEGKHLSQVALEEVIRGCRSIHGQAVVQFKEEAKQKLEHAGIDPSIISGIRQFDLRDPFESLQSAYLRKKFYIEQFGYMVSIFNSIG